MNRSTTLRNKLVYLAIIILMLLPLYLLGQPATGKPGELPGQLTQMRAEMGLAESSLGEIDPASESMKLASLGLRGIAATLLWKKADEYKVLHEWDRLSATLNQIAHLQPHYEKVWEHQAHNLAYNVSVEFDDYRQRYQWVKKGTSYLSEGVRRNRTAPRLVWYTGWFYGNKMGMSDEKVQFRELFRNDEPFHERIAEEGIAADSPDARGPDGRPDSWLVGRLWANRGYDLVENGVRLTDKSPITFYELGPKWRILHASSIEDEGVLDYRSKEAWERAADDWYGYGVRPIPTSDGFSVQLANIGDLYARRGELMERFEELVGGTIETVRAKAYEALSEQERAALETPESERDEATFMLARAAEEKVQSNPIAIAKAAEENVRLKAIQLASEIAEIDMRISKTNIYRDQMNYGYWELRSKAEQDDLVLEARKLLYEAQQLYELSDLDGEISKYEQAFAEWEKVFDEYPGLILDVSSDELTEAIERYRVATDQPDLPEDFPLADFYRMRKESAFSTPDEYQRIRSGEAPRTPDMPTLDITQPFSGQSDPSAPASAQATSAPALIDEGLPVAPETASPEEAKDTPNESSSTDDNPSTADKPTEEPPAGDPLPSENP